MLTKWDRTAIMDALPELKAIRERLTALHNKRCVSMNYSLLLNGLHCQVFSVITQLERKLAENAANEAQQAQLFETVRPDAPGMMPIMNYRDRGSRAIIGQIWA